jgi:hypothetical protein
MELGDVIEAALTKVGITTERIERWLKVKCGCRERRDKLNALSAWARRIIHDKTDKASEYLEGILN